MRIPIDERFIEDAERFQLRFTCVDCLLDLGDDGCAHEWPNQEHVLAPALGEVVVFCKEFELK
jgi:hypothetical protein